MSARKRVAAVLTSATPDWDAVSLSDITSYAQTQIQRFKHARRSKRPDAAKKLESICGKWKKLASALAAKRAVRGLPDLDKAIHELERNMEKPERINPFDSYKLAALKAERDRLKQQQSARPPRRKART